MINAEQIQGHWDAIRGKLKQRWGELTDDDLNIAAGNVTQLIGAIETKTGEGRARIERFIDELVEDEDSSINRARQTARDYAQQAGERAREGYAQLARPMRQRYAGFERRVKEHPAQTTFATFGLGVIVGLALGLMIRSE